MIKKKDIFCIIPARKGSKRLKNKNILPYKNKPIICYTIESALKSKIFNKIFVSSDSPKVKNICKKYKKVIFLQRKSSLSNSKATVSDVCLDILNNQNFDASIKYFCVLYPTSHLKNSVD